MRILIYLCILIFCFTSCKNEVNNESVDSNTKTIIDTSNIIIPFNVYEKADSLNILLFGEKLNYKDFNKSSKRLPKHIHSFTQNELIKTRAYINKGFKYVYSYFIFEYKSSIDAENAYQKIVLVTNEINNIIDKNHNSKIYEFPKNVNQLFYISKMGHLIFRNDKYIISSIENYFAPPTVNKMEWSEYKKTFLNCFLNKNQLKTNYIDSAWSIEGFWEETFKH